MPASPYSVQRPARTVRSTDVRVGEQVRRRTSHRTGTETPAPFRTVALIDVVGEPDRYGFRTVRFTFTDGGVLHVSEGESVVVR